MKTIDKIQKVYKLGKVLSKICFIFSIVSLCMVVVSLTMFSIFDYNNVEINGKAFALFISEEVSLKVSDVYCSLAAAIVHCAFEIVLSKFAENYFKNELKDGTPFTLKGSKELKRLGILAIVIPIIASLVASIVVAIIDYNLGTQTVIEENNYISIGLGVMMIVMSLVCKYGAETTQNNDKLIVQSEIVIDSKNENNNSEAIVENTDLQNISNETTINAEDLKVYTDSLKDDEDSKS